MTVSQTVPAIQHANQLKVSQLIEWMNAPGATLFMEQLQALHWAKVNQSGAEMVAATLSGVPLDSIRPESMYEAARLIQFIDLFEAMRTGKYENSEEPFVYLECIQPVNQPTP